MISDPKHTRIDGHMIGSANVSTWVGNVICEVSDRSNAPRLSTNQNPAFLHEVRYYECGTFDLNHGLLFLL